MRIVLGFRAHSGWAALVAVAGPPEKLRIMDRRRIAIADPDVPHAKQPYHAAAELPLPKAVALVQSCIDSSRSLAAEALKAATRYLRIQGHQVAGCAVVTGSGKPLPPLEKILASHSLIHTAEGEMFRNALLHGAADCGLPACGIREKDLDPALLTSVSSLGKLVGPPWTLDQKYATAAAVMSLR